MRRILNSVVSSRLPTVPLIPASSDLPNNNQHRVEPEQMLQDETRSKKLLSTFFKFLWFWSNSFRGSCV